MSWSLMGQRVALVDPPAWLGALLDRGMKQRDGPRSRKPASLPVLVLDQCNRLLKQHSEQGEAGRRRARGAMSVVRAYQAAAPFFMPRGMGQSGGAPKALASSFRACSQMITEQRLRRSYGCSACFIGMEDICLLHRSTSTQKPMQAFMNTRTFAQGGM